MGNYSLNICCEQHGVNTLFTLKESTLAETPLLLTDLQRKFVDSHNSFANEHRKTVTLKINKEDLFEGEVDQKGNPKGYGIFKSHDEQAIYYGKFSELGVDGGKLFYVMPDGSYYEGNLLAGFGITGAYTIPQKGYSYKGDLLHRPDQQIKYIPHGMGIEESTYTFTGKFQHGKRRQGKLQWTQNGSRNIYEGDFDEHQLFTAKGVLKQKTGTYTGHFLKGKKQGHGKYEYLMGLIYEGEYRDGMKNGRGKLLNFDRVLSYEGEFKDGVPHGTGTAYPPNKGPYITEFVQGITKENHRILIGELNVSKARFDL